MSSDGTIGPRMVPHRVDMSSDVGEDSHLKLVFSNFSQDLRTLSVPVVGEDSRLELVFSNFFHRLRAY
jgi:hypothetical protein